MSEPITADGLRAWARGIYPSEAAVELLLSACHGRFAKPSDFVRPGDQPGSWWIDLDALTDWVGDNPWSSGERKVVSIATSLLGAAQVNLGDVLPGLDPDVFQLVQQSFTHAHGERPPAGPAASPKAGPAESIAGAGLAISDLSRPLVDAWSGLDKATKAVTVAADSVELDQPEVAHLLQVAAAGTSDFLAVVEGHFVQLSAARSTLRDLVGRAQAGTPTSALNPDLRAALRDVRAVAAGMGGLDPAPVLACQRHTATDVEAKQPRGLDGILAAVAGLQRRTVALNRACLDTAHGLQGIERRLTQFLAPVPIPRTAAPLAGQEQLGPRR